MKAGWPALALSCALLAAPYAVPADSYHNVRGFFGERASGLAGAFTAVSDDPSGAYYNPAGLAFAYDNYISLSAVNYSEVRKTYHSVFGPGQDVERTSRRYTPGFFGAVKSFGDTKFAFTVVSPTSENFDTAEKTSLPLQRPAVGRRETDFTQDTNIIYLGPSLARSFGEKLSLGATLYYFLDSARTTTVNYTEFLNGRFLLENVEDRRRTMGVLPILGLQYMPSRTWSLGASVRRSVVSARSRRRTRIVADSSRPTISGLTIEESTTQGYGATREGVLYQGEGLTGGVPTPAELRLGVAFFPSRSLLISADIIHTGGHRQSRSNIVFLTASPFLQVRPGDHPNTVHATTNAALGLEAYVSERWALRGGLFTNRSNHVQASWSESLVVAGIRAGGLECPVAAAACLPVTDERTEQVHTAGISLGVSRSDATSSASATVVYENGRGGATAEPTLPSHSLTYRSMSLIVVFSLRN